MPTSASTSSWPADAVERRPIAQLMPYARNPRKHSAEQVRKIALSILKFGFTIPVLVDEEGGIIAGHGRVLAAKQLKMIDVPVMIARGWSQEQRSAYVIADNQLSLTSEWDADTLRSEFADLPIDLQMVTGFDLAEMAKMFGFNADAGAFVAQSQELSDSLIYQVVVDCRDETEQADVLKAVKAQGLNCRPITM